MKVKEAIEQLQGLDPEENIIMAYWLRDMFPEIPKHIWDDWASEVEMETDWSSAHDKIQWEWDNCISSLDEEDLKVPNEQES